MKKWGAYIDSSLVPEQCQPVKPFFRGVIGTISRVEVLIRSRINHSRPRLYRTTDQLITENPTEKIN